MAKKIALGSVVVVGLCFAGCASIATSNLFGPGNFYSDTSIVGQIRGEASSKVWLGFFGKESYPSAERVAKENGITKIATVEHYSKPGILLIWTEYTTIVTGQ